MAKPGRKPGTPKTGGRQKGTANKLTDETRELIERTLGCSPLEKMARLAAELLDGTRVLTVPMRTKDGDDDEPVASDAKAVEVATKLLCEIAQYCAPKRKAIEHSGPGGSAIPLGGGLTIEVVHSGANGNGNGRH
jgi:hypothetical protein